MHTASSNDCYCFHNNRIHMEMKGGEKHEEKIYQHKFLVYNGDGFDTSIMGAYFW